MEMESVDVDLLVTVKLHSLFVVDFKQTASSWRTELQHNKYSHNFFEN